ncbi:MAG: class I SAM-dependent methyltransferase [Deltaproteobacteria bacterium]
MSESPKQAVKAYWEAEPCGSRGYDPTDDEAFFRDTEAARYRLDGSLIFGFAEFPRWRGKRVLEIGVGTGTDFLQWARSGAAAVGVDLTKRAALLTRRRLAREKLDRPVYVADAEQLPFADGSFDLVYSWGVLHHSPNTEKTLAEVRRVLAPGGEARIMLYHRRSWIALMAWLRHGPLAGHPFASASAVLSAHVESPGTKAYTVAEIRHLFARFDNVEVTPRLTPYDTFDFQPRDVHGRWLRQAAHRLYPRRTVRALGDGFGWNLLIRAS